ncbi:acylphosphatase [Leptolyngbya sp. PCC 6406]|uniref:acylphosphatase n=1 Tax=Leptolyngbya sp. PCC 6406 TaxID=1173264 RepID=UPI0002AC5FAF|nr:acylphosphatase [Leptolyngbya sp. PCC 6406]
MQRITIIVHGIVQGVGYRYHTRVKAIQLGLTGYVLNCCPEGTVKIVAEGHPEALTQLLNWAKEGPTAAKVSHTDVTYSDAQGEFPSFNIER